MRWSAKGAHAVITVRAHHFNALGGDLAALPQAA
jgi:hypothetical protein